MDADSVAGFDTLANKRCGELPDATIELPKSKLVSIATNCGMVRDPRRGGLE